MVDAQQVFALPVFFICFRECLECSIIVSILLSWLKQTLHRPEDQPTRRKLVKQVWIGTLIGIIVCLAIGGGMIGAFYRLGLDAWAQSEELWEGIFAVIACIIITLMGAALLRVSKMQDKWRVKLERALESRKGKQGSSPVANVKIGKRDRIKAWTEKYAMLLLPLVTVLREGLEAVIFIGGVGLGLPATSFPLAVITGLLAGALIGFIIYKGGNATSIQFFLILSTCFLYLIAAGLFSKAVGYFEAYRWNGIVGGDAGEAGDGPGSYDIRQTVWHVNCCNPEINGGGGWGVFNALLGWNNTATYGAVISYNVYWIVVILGFLAMRFREQRGHWPLLKPRAKDVSSEDGGTTSDEEVKAVGKEADVKVANMA